MRAILLAGAAALAIAGSLNIASAQPIDGNVLGAAMQSNGLLKHHDSDGANQATAYVPQGRSVAENENEASNHRPSFHFLGASGDVP
jgi:hypothetical protein